MIQLLEKFIFLDVQYFLSEEPKEEWLSYLALTTAILREGAHLWTH
jgi:hypothetical protein